MHQYLRGGDYVEVVGVTQRSVNQYLRGGDYVEVVGVSQ